MKGVCRQGAHPGGSGATRFATFLLMLSVLLVLHPDATLSDRTDFRQLDRILNPAGTLSADERIDRSWVQPRGVGAPVFIEVRALVPEQAWAQDRGHAPGLPASLVAPDTFLQSESILAVGGEFRPSGPTRAFDARAPPSYI